MNRPSRTDDDLEHPTWNQNPPFLAPDLTTREDLNGIANSRELKNATGGSVEILGLSEQTKIRHDADRDTDDGSRPPLEIVPLQEHLRRLFSETSSSKTGSWILWLISVLATSFIMSLIGRPPHAINGSAAAAAATAETTITDTPPRGLYRRDQCEEGGVRSEDYNVPLHVGALFIVMFVSTVACALPILAKGIPKLRIPPNFFFVVRHFGSGVLIATAFVHLLPTAFLSLGDPCLSTFWVNDYPAMPGAISLVGVFFVMTIEMVFSPARHFAPTNPALPSGAAAAGPGNRSQASLDDDLSDTPVEPRSMEMGIARRDVIAPQGSLVVGGNPSGTGPLDKGAKEPQVSPPGNLEAEFFSSHFLTEEQKVKKSVLQCVLLEIGILFHSVFIGMALSVAIGGDFIVLLIAIIFHQSFEGLALGSRIAEIDWSSHPSRPWIMAIAYGLTTPIGQAIGLATHTLYNPGSSFGLVLVGTMNAISAGLLIYASLVELLAADFLSDESWNTLRGKRRVIACVIVFAGAFCMALVGAWA